MIFIYNCFHFEGLFFAFMSSNSKTSEKIEASPVKGFLFLAQIEKLEKDFLDCQKSNQKELVRNFI